MSDCTKEYDCKQLLLDCGLSRRKSELLASSLKAAIRKQEAEKTCNCKTKETVVENKPVKKKKDVNEVLDLRSEN